MNGFLQKFSSFPHFINFMKCLTRSPVRALRRRLLRRPHGPKRPHPPLHQVRLQRQRRPGRDRELRPQHGRVPQVHPQHGRLQLRAVQVRLLRRRPRPEAAGRPPELPDVPVLPDRDQPRQRDDAAHLQRLHGRLRVQAARRRQELRGVRGRLLQPGERRGERDTK